MPDHARIAEGEAIVEGEIPVDCRGILRRVFYDDGDWMTQVEFRTRSGGFHRIALPLLSVKQVLLDRGR